LREKWGFSRSRFSGRLKCAGFGMTPAMSDIQIQTVVN